MSEPSTPAPPVTAEQVDGDVSAWLAAHWRSDRSLITWRRTLAESGWAVPSWPVAWHGRGLPGWADDVAAAALARIGAVGTPPGAGMGLAAPTILTHGRDTVKALLLGRIVTGEDTWCQLFSEPGSGSDLAGLSTTARLDGDEWIIDGQKLWSTSAHHADLGLLLARTDWDVPKHRGITCFALPMHQPGVEARPLAQMNGHASFNEVFLTGARVPATHVIGAVGEGWRVALTTLAHERRFGGMRRSSIDASAGQVLAEAAAEADDHFRTYEWYPQRAGRVDLLVDRAAASGVRDDPLVRARVAAVLSLQRTQQWTAQRAQAARVAGKSPGAEGSIGKLGTSHVARAAAATHGLIGGASGMLTGADAPLHGVVAEVLVSVP
ncbi:MAG: putative acyl-CoA dehydrogenase, partial [Ilumatobacteraceae bacterium]|nr:putative acyl-CoA dehydrogenase [Ilumatobacteraceae bacterium]